MIFENDQQIFEFIQAHKMVTPWVAEARKNAKEFNALVTGKDFHDLLITKIEKIESVDRQNARKKYTKDIRDMFDRLFIPRTSIFNAFGGSLSHKAEGNAADDLLKRLTNFKGQKSIKKYLSEHFFQLMDVDPNGILFMEYVGDEKIYPTYKSINDIRYYKSNGQLLEVLLFEPVIVREKNGDQWTKWRVVDKNVDYCIRERNNSFEVYEEKTFVHPFSTIPAVILSDLKRVGSEIRLNAINEIKELASDYARDKSILTIYKFQNGFPRHWRYETTCRSCQGLGKKDGAEGKKENCSACDGKGYSRKTDVTDITILEMPRDNEDAKVAPNVEGFVSPDLETWKQYKEDLKDLEHLIESTTWGTKRLREGANETATGRFIDVQPVMMRLDKLTDNVEWVHNQLVHFVEDWLNGQTKTEYEYHITYGRRFIIESPDILLEKYVQATKDGANNTTLDKLLDEYLMSKYQNNPVMLDEMLKKRAVEPYVHNDLKTVNDIFGNIEANKKIIFVKWWETLTSDHILTTDKQSLNQEWETYFEANNKIQAPAPPTIQQ